MKLHEIARALNTRFEGDGSVEITGVASITSASAQDVIFVEEQKYLDRGLECAAGAVISGEFALGSRGKPLLITDQPKLAFARAAKLLTEAKQSSAQHNIHPNATIHPSARLASGVYVEERTAIAEGVQIGENSRIGAGCHLGRNVRIGRNCEIYPHVTIYAGTTLGDRIIVHAGAVLGSDGFGYVRDPLTGRYEKFPQIGILVIEDDVEIGANSTIDRGALDETRIGRGTKIDNLVHVGHNCRLGENVVIAAQTGISGSVVIENDVVLGGQVGIADHVRLEEGVIVGAQAGVPSRKIVRGKGVVFWGTPARPIQQYLKQLAAMAKLGGKR
jgi:UDP-3-O-[3-hydroxymyristoyl] glucosamine N-acyltransferase